ncbi:MAG: nitroreductase family protein, partial [Clostridiales bacterium]
PKSGEISLVAIENIAFLQELNQQTLEYMLHCGNDFLESRAALPGYQPLYNAPLLIVVAAAQDNPYGQASAACAATNMAIAASELNLGSCVVASPIPILRQNQTLLAKLKLPEDLLPQCGLLAGYSGGEKFTAANKFPAKVIYYR